MKYHGTKDKFALDVISGFSDDELYKNISKIRQEINETQKKQPKFTKKIIGLEIEACYLQREIQIRETRKVKHTTYVKSRMNSSFNRFQRA